MKLNMKESNGGVETIRYGANDLKGLNKYRVDLYKPNSDWTALIKRTYVYAKDENDARTQLFNDIPNDVKKKYGFTDVEVAPIEVNKVKESLNMREARYGLEPQYDARKSFYGKAHVESDNGVLTLYSYNTPVCRIEGDKVTLLDLWDSSQTTLRHVKEFLQQNGFKVGSKAQIAKLYGESFKKSSRRSFKEAVNGGWEVDESDVWDAYELASEYWGGDDAINKDIVRTLSDSELAEALAYIFRMNDFREWDEYINGEDED